MNRDIRRQVALAAREYQEKKITWKQFIDVTADFRDDEMIDELVDLIWHEPKHGGFFGVREKAWITYQKEIEDLISSLEKS